MHERTGIGERRVGARFGRERLRVPAQRCAVLRGAQAAQRVLMRDDAGARAAEVQVRAGVIEMVVGVDEDLDRERRNRAQARFERRGQRGDAAIDQQQAAGAMQDRNISARSGEQGELVPERLEREFRSDLAGGGPQRRCEGGDHFDKTATRDTSHVEYCTRRRRPSPMARTSSCAAASGSAAATSAETTASPSAPAAMTSAALPALIPPIATSWWRVARRSSASPPSPQLVATFVFVGVG